VIWLVQVAVFISSGIFLIDQLRDFRAKKESTLREFATIDRNWKHNGAARYIVRVVRPLIVHCGNDVLMTGTQCLLHLSHTDIRRDARILRQIQALQELPDTTVSAIGVELDEDASEGASASDFQIQTVQLRSKRFRYVPRPLRYLLNLVELMCRVLPIAIRHRPAVVHCHDTMMLPLGAMVSLAVGSVLVYDAHELESHKSGQSKLLSWGTELVERLCWSRIALFISVSPAIVDWYHQRFGVRRSIVVLNTPIVSQHWSDGVNRPMVSAVGQRYFHRLYGLEARTIVFIYVGLLVSGRGIERLLEVFSRSGINSHVIFMGYGDQVGVSDWACRHANIHLHPAVSHERMVPLISEADCGLCLIEDVSLSDRLCLPNKLFEYAFAGVPVLASRLPEISRVVGEYGLGICCDSDAGSIEAAVRKVEREGIQAPKGKLAELSWGAQAARLKSAYRTLLSERKPVTPNSMGTS